VTAAKPTGDASREGNGASRTVDLARSIVADLTHPLWASASDEEIADHHRVSARVVGDLRRRLRRDLRVGRIISLGAELAEILGLAREDIGNIVCATLTREIDRLRGAR
jgi:hypothetical protein